MYLIILKFQSVGLIKIIKVFYEDFKCTCAYDDAGAADFGFYCRI